MADEESRLVAGSDSYWRRRVENDLSALYASVLIAYGAEEAQRLIDAVGDLYSIELPF